LSLAPESQVTLRHSCQKPPHWVQEAPSGCEGLKRRAELPKDVRPVLGTNLVGSDDIVNWLAARIMEIENFTASLPSLAVLVNEEADVEPIAKALDAALADANIRAKACVRGQSVGQENDVRVFDVQHIKGLEFEGVFFVGVDRLAETNPDLFDKYLYVGTTRAAYYLGLTVASGALPEKLGSLVDAFQEKWP
jgi:DNA helicase IV